jgi:type IV secretion system protein VirB2
MIGAPLFAIVDPALPIDFREWREPRIGRIGQYAETISSRRNRKCDFSTSEQTMYYHAGSLSDAPSSSVLVGAVLWLQDTVLGTVATSVAVTAVAWVGMLMLAGRLDIRRGLTVVLGCFMVFGATSIVAGIRSATEAGGSVAVAAIPPPPLPPMAHSPRNRDPYAGASILP